MARTPITPWWLVLCFALAGAGVGSFPARMLASEAAPKAAPEAPNNANVTAIASASASAPASDPSTNPSTPAANSPAAASPAYTPNVAPGAALHYEKDIRPLLKTHCFHCHGEERELKGGLDLRLRRLMVAGGKSGPALAPGSRDGSHLFELISTGEMPPEDSQALTPEEIALIGKWIDAGAPTARPEPEDLGNGGLLITEEERSHWSFRPIQRPAIPIITASPAGPSGEKGESKENPDTATNSAASPAAAPASFNPIDAFLLAKLQEKGLGYSPRADKITLIRRAYFDLTGLPPSPEDVRDFLADESPMAWERLIDRLLASPHYGERWGRHWLDVAGYADSEGYNDKDADRPDAWAYRDYVIRALNADMPWDRFIVEQLAGDELAGATAAGAQALTKDPAKLDLLTATGFLRMAPDGTGSSPADLEDAKNQVITETVKIVSSSLLGMTIGCAECHYHRFDPIPQEDFYRLRAVFAPVYDTEFWRKPSARRLSLISDADAKTSAEIEAEAKKVDAEYIAEMMRVVGIIFERELERVPEDKREFARTAYETDAKERTPEQVKFLTEEYPAVNVQRTTLHLFLANYEDGDELKKDYEALLKKAQGIRAKKPQPDYVRIATEDTGKIPVTHVFYRGDHTSPEEAAVPPGGLTVLSQLRPNTFPENDPTLPTTGRRLAYARYLTSGHHPLTARVLVNRFWLLHFGKGLVNTPGDFGAQGERPSHPELLDYLASSFMDGGWRLKPLQRLIMTSQAYQQSSRRHDRGDAIDADARLLWRMPVRRLEAETVRDAVLAVSGTLNDQPYGAPVPVSANDDGLFEVAGGKPSADLHELRRSVYVEMKRTEPVSLLEVFDAPRMEPNCERRQSSTVTTQALSMMNGDFVLEQSRHFAQRVLDESGAGAGAALLARTAWRLAYGAPPSADQEVELTLYLAEQTQLYKYSPPPAEKGQKLQEPQQLALATLCQVLLGANQFLYVD